MRIAIYKNGVFQRFGNYPAADLSTPVSTDDGTDFRIERTDEIPITTDEQRIHAETIDDDGFDVEYPHLKVRRYRYTAVDLTVDELRERKLARLSDRYQTEKSALSDLSEDEIDFRVGIMPILNLVDRSGLPAGQQNRFIAERDKVVAYQTKFIANRNNAQTLRDALNAATTIQQVRAVDINSGWAA